MWWGAALADIAFGWVRIGPGLALILGRFMPYVFISYVRENAEVVDRLAAELRRRGVIVWLDRDDIEPGARSWQEAIKNAIRGGKFFLACFSKEYHERDRTYMNEELTLAVEELRARPLDRTWFIPILINETMIPRRPISRAEDLSDIQAVKLYENWDKELRRILHALKHDDPVSAHIYYLTGILEHPFRAEWLHALQQLRTYGPDAAEALPILIKILKGDPNVPDVELRSSAAAALQAIGRAAVPALTEALKDQAPYARSHAALALAGIGPAAADAVPALTEALKDQDAVVRYDAALALGGIGPAAAMPCQRLPRP
jgi:TIR domain/HEAT repeats